MFSRTFLPIHTLEDLSVIIHRHGELAKMYKKLESARIAGRLLDLEGSHRFIYDSDNYRFLVSIEHLCLLPRIECRKFYTLAYEKSGSFHNIFDMMKTREEGASYLHKDERHIDIFNVPDSKYSMRVYTDPDSSIGRDLTLSIISNSDFKDEMAKPMVNVFSIFNKLSNNE